MNDAAVTLGRRTFPIILAAPSGAGKTTIAQRLREERGDVVFSVSATTRPPRSYEIEGQHYFFTTEPRFRAMIAAGELIEWAEVHGHLYGTPRRNLEQAIENRQFLLLDIDVQGSHQIRRGIPEAVSIFVLPPSGAELARRLNARGSENEAVRRRRLTNAIREIRQAAEFDYVIVNQDLSEAVRAVDAIISSETLRGARAPELRTEVERICGDIQQALGSREPEPQTETETKERVQ